MMPKYRVSVPSTTWLNFDVAANSKEEAIDSIRDSEDRDLYYVGWTESSADFEKTEAVEQ